MKITQRFYGCSIRRTNTLRLFSGMGSLPSVPCRQAYFLPAKNGSTADHPGSELTALRLCQPAPGHGIA